MYPLNVILIGCDEDSSLEVRHELELCPALIEAAYRDVDAVIHGPRKSKGEKRLLILQVNSQREIETLTRLSLAYPNWPVLVLLGGVGSGGASREMIVGIMRAGASQIIPLPLDRDDFRAALDRISMQFVQDARNTKVITVAGATGGTGATTIAINLAFEIARQHSLTCVLVDLSLRLGVIASHLNIEPRHTISDLLLDIRRLDAHLAHQALTRYNEQLAVLAGPLQLAATAPTSAQDVRHVIDMLRQIADVVVIDVPCTYDDVYFGALSDASQAVLIGEQKIPSIRALKMTHDALQRPPGATHLVINRYDPRNRAFMLDRLLKPLGVSEALKVARDDRALDLALIEASPLRMAAPHSPALHDIVNLASTVLDLKTSRQDKGPGFLGRIGRALTSK